MRKWIIGAALVVLVAACSSTPEKTETPADETAATPATTAAPGATTSGTTTSGITGTAKLAFDLMKNIITLGGLIGSSDKGPKSPCSAP